MLNKLNTELEIKVQAFLLDSQNLKLRDEIYELCQRPLFNIAKKFKLPPMLERNDLIQEGYLCLEYSLEKYQDNLSNFITFFSNQAKKTMQKLINKTVGIKKHEAEYNKLAIQYNNEDIEEKASSCSERYFIDPHQALMQEIKAEKIITKIKSAKLTKNELQVLALITNLNINQGTHDVSLPELTNIEIANQLNLTIRQVENFKYQIMKKLKTYFKTQIITENDHNYIRIYTIKNCYHPKTKLYNYQQKNLIAIIIKKNGLCFLTTKFHDSL
ncbi:DNA-dependent RNA polymerase sigma subunits [Candidatus Phytoplasma mali]|uniref:DNA-dependent RNA polymerase sigma subunits n=1 Tax=Phytoplasma mali (strain AT) TaxID=482235 RepID=B3QZH7_PHYMT|nr:sigma-70 family RNA polymerase sigma factor [Candidatus Phytoplasma mali]CAP18584.1 DNA-dependent RNA polymerase sigma subunits [Candidatus Phytoplasma mali]